MNASERLKILRKLKGMSQADCAKALNIDRTTYAKYENGGSIRRSVEKLANFFNVSVDYLLGRMDEHNEEPENNIVINRNAEPVTISPQSLPNMLMLTKQEINLIKKFRTLDARGQKTVEDTIERETNFSTAPLIKNEKAM